MLASFVALGLLRALYSLTRQEFLWAYPRHEAWLVVVVYGCAVIAALTACGAGTRLTRAGAKSLRWAGLTGVLGGAWVLLFLIHGETQLSVGANWAVASGQVRPARITYNPDDLRIRINGPLTRGTAARFNEALELAPAARVVEITSPGGLIDEARWISALLEARRMDTLVSDECASACVSIFASGQRRIMYADALVGLHSARSLTSDTAVVATANQKFFERLHKIGVEPRFLTIGTETPADDLWINTARQAYLAGLATAVVEPPRETRRAVQ